MQIATGGSMLNFGYWTNQTSTPIEAQENLCKYFGKITELESAKNAIDTGSGLSAPAIFWKHIYEKLNLFCVNINYKQLSFCGPQKNLEFINSTSTKLPFLDNSVDRIMALESSQHFKPLNDFFTESKRVLKDSGFLTLALPVVILDSSIRNLGILKFTWSSEHYPLEYVKGLLKSNGFSIEKEELIGSRVYEPLAEYYVKNRSILKNSIKKQYPDFVEKVLYKSILKMKKASEEKIIDYAILKCHL
ncbi:MAG: methyltransferase domain-containing protein [Nitrosopumilaceae archaeon]|nr:methyltransferase domain-containing protein [Nitrosopumilaceae archaeon]NIP09384.1 methyltransferase domain-containing protein [Nitrosopumilaceae archaeon]NIS94614.1 methyltransferase domain-containing protein [Nitrosopumilaceae archaeon]